MNIKKLLCFMGYHKPIYVYGKIDLLSWERIVNPMKTHKWGIACSRCKLRKYSSYGNIFWHY